MDVVLGLVNDQLGLVDCKSFLLCFTGQHLQVPALGAALEKALRTGSFLGGGLNMVGATDLPLVRPWK